MNIIGKLKNLFKARFGTFTEKEFGALCTSYSESAFFDSKKQNAGSVLGVYFRHKIPTQTELNTVYKCGDELKWLYLRNISKKRKLTDYEQKYMAAFMNFGPVFRFPQQLNDEAVQCLFEVSDIRRISTYVRDFMLPERFELELIRRYELQKPYVTPSKAWGRDYRYVLDQYLDHVTPGRCSSFKVQEELLRVADEELWEKLCSSQNMTVNVLEKNTIRELISHGYDKALRALLMHSFIPTQELQCCLLSAFPGLKWELEISKIRHALRKIEVESGKILGVEIPTHHEAMIIEASFLVEDMSDFAEYSVKPRIKHGIATPYFCAWAVSVCPGLGEEAYDCLRNFVSRRFK